MGLMERWQGVLPRKFARSVAVKAELTHEATPRSASQYHVRVNLDQYNCINVTLHGWRYSRPIYRAMEVYAAITVVTVYGEKSNIVCRGSV